MMRRMKFIKEDPNGERIYPNVSTKLLENSLETLLESGIYENMWEVIDCANQLLKLKKNSKKAYFAAATACKELDYMKDSLEYLNRMLKHYPFDIDAISLKASVLDNIFYNTNDPEIYAECVKTTSKLLEITNNDPSAVGFIQNYCRTVFQKDIKIIDQALDIAPHDKNLLYSKGIIITEKFEKRKADKYDFADLISIIEKMQRLYPDSQHTETLINDSYNTLNSDLQRTYRKALNMPELHEPKVIYLKK